MRSGGMSALPRAVRHGTALCVAALQPEAIEPLRLCKDIYFVKNL